MEASKVTLSEAEQRLIADARIILTKNHAIDKIVEMFGNLANDFRQQCLHLATVYPSIFGTHPKISRGEKHDGLPWVILDYPRVFDKKKGHLAVRCFFWWGHFFSIQLQVSGSFLMPVWLAAKANSGSIDWMTGFTNDPWDFKLPNDGWQSFDQLPENPGGMFLKMAKKIPINKWESVEYNFSKDYHWLTMLLEKALST